MENNVDNEETYNQKLEEVHAILEYLAAKHNMTYVLQLAKVNKTTERVSENEIIFDTNINNEAIMKFDHQLDDLYQTMNTVADMVKSGEMVVVCVDDRGQLPTVKDHVKKDAVYCVDIIMHTKESRATGVYSYKLRGMDAGAFDGYNSKRFRIVTVKEHQN